jgi:hypothetical protein
LTRAGAGRPLKYLRESLTNPSADIPREYEGVVVTTADGTRVSGVRVNRLLSHGSSKKPLSLA